MRVGRRGFSLLEVAIIIAVIVLLFSLMMAAASSARAQSRCVTCMSNMRQISEAAFAYAEANGGKVYPCDCLLAQVALPDANQAADIPALTAFTGDRRVFHCVDDPRDGCRSYSINDHVGGTYPTMKHVSDIQLITNAATTFLFIEETPPATRNGFTGGFVVLPYPSERWADAPSVVHPRGTCLSFADGHCEFWQWVDPRTAKLSPFIQYPRTQDNPDLVRLQRASAGGPIPPQH